MILVEADYHGDFSEETATVLYGFCCFCASAETDPAVTEMTDMETAAVLLSFCCFFADAAITDSAGNSNTNRRAAAYLRQPDLFFSPFSDLFSLFSFFLIHSRSIS